ncbi:MAG: phosphoglucosamine mutase [Deltaproteobacteria bacterium]|nr:phosphoglucosamine mutase [Deltaproteobacteria bacterium]
MRKLFGTDGIRGVANVYPMTVEVALQLGKGCAYIFKDKNRRHKIVVGKDTRLSGYMMETAITAGICSMGGDVILVGPLPTPGIAFITTSMRADAGIVISASHNAYQDNGIKIFSSNGFKLPDQMEERIEDLMFSEELSSSLVTANKVGKAFRIEDAIGRYIVFLKNTYPQELTLDGLSIVLDCANGATYKVAPTVFEELGAEVTLLGAKPNGENINKNCGALYPGLVSAMVRKKKADLGISFDGDGDRVVFVDENGDILNGDQIMAICASRMSKEKRLKKNTLVTTVMSNMGLEVSMREKGIRLVRTQVGDRYVVEEMVKRGCNFGGEQSGHLIFLDHNPTGDGILSALQLLAIMQKEEKSLSDLSDIMDHYPQKLVNVRIRERRRLEEFPAVIQQIKKVERKLGEKGRLLVRFSGTEPLVRVMVEGENEKEIVALAEETARVIEREFNA